MSRESELMINKYIKTPEKKQGLSQTEEDELLKHLPTSIPSPNLLVRHVRWKNTSLLEMPDSVIWGGEVNQIVNMGEVIAVGDSAYNHRFEQYAKNVPWCKVGDIVSFQQGRSSMVLQKTHGRITSINDLDVIHIWRGRNDEFEYI